MRSSENYRIAKDSIIDFENAIEKCENLLKDIEIDRSIDHIGYVEKVGTLNFNLALNKFYLLYINDEINPKNKLNNISQYEKKTAFSFIF